MTGDASLNAARRARELAALAAGEVVDVLVVGLGVTGAGVALDAASRGLSVAALDAHDLAFGTSRWSSKLVHGGLRYLARGEVGIAYESARERGILLTRTAPHLTRPLPFVLPLTPAVPPRQAALAAAGSRAGDLLRLTAGTPRQTLPSPRRLTPAETRHLVPGVRAGGLRGGLLHWDGQLEDDARLVIALARTAAAHGARILPRCRAEELVGDGALVTDTLTGERFTIRARAVINATGVWAGQLVPGVTLRPSQGTHVVLPATALGGPAAALTAPVPGEHDRFVFALPQPDGLVYAGLTDEPVDGPVPDVPRPTEAEIGFLLDVLNLVLDTGLSRADVLGAFAGLRPLLPGGGRTADLSRRHAVLTSPDGVVTVVGGKLTTYRRMAEDAVDTAIRERGLAAGPCRTTRLPLVGAAPPAQLAALPAPRRLVRRYGLEAPMVAAEAGDDPDLLAPVAPGVPVTGAELLWAIRHEGALTEDDLLDRRTRLGLVPAHREAALPMARALLAAQAQAF
ncbi:glycerol-3-phosphate dehydrogenase [Carbonactinospora thermoautotrophica]|uniref:glycerol-3-phosphate dehydrogenase/oxidase n=1 Tax=Carbonactinospora thermoautotrophica TaxID=1469144 RepID=UPI00226D54BB|nr:glycerol-3-phosphate dehydrogenase/oxidase [Carbonactinospora thermoautotrophica]MCX9193363.1 glycerol-3-phosphate dehydrogenase [Carbonactinospora thermoautotrophica]